MATATTDERFYELILYVADRCAQEKSFGITKLNKILFSADFLHYGMTGESISGQEYQKLKHGPAPRRMLPALRELTQSGEAVVRVDHQLGFPRKRVIALREPDPNAFTGQQVAIIERVLRHFEDMSAIAASKESHEFIGWRAVEYGETIPYEAVFGWWTRPLTEREKKVGRELSRTSAA